MRNFFKIKSIKQFKLFIKNTKMNSIIKEDFLKLKEFAPYNSEKINELKDLRKLGLYVSELVTLEIWEKQKDIKKKVLADFMYFKNRYPDYSYISEDTLNNLLIEYNITKSKTNSHKFSLNNRVRTNLMNFNLDDSDVHFYIESTISFWSAYSSISNSSYTLRYIKQNPTSFTQINESTYTSNSVNYNRDTMYILYSPLYSDYIILHPISRESRKGFLIVATSHDIKNEIKNRTNVNNRDDNMTTLIEGIKVKRGKDLSENLTDEEIMELIDSL